MRFQTLTGLGTNPNLGAVIVISLHTASAMPIAEAISQSGIDVEPLAFQELGSSLKCIEHGVRLAVKLVKKCSAQLRKPFPLSQLRMGVECGGSDFSSGISGNPAVGNAADRLLDRGGTVLLSETPEITGAEHILARRATNQKVARKLTSSVKKMETLAKKAGFSDIRASNPSADNIKGGLTTLAEKSLGAILKAGTKPLIGVLDYSEKIPVKNGFYFMHTAAPACESLSGLAAGGVQLVVFNTGLGNPIANPVTPTIKVSGNPYTVKKSGDDLDLDLSGIVTRGFSIESAGERVFEEILSVANGKMTFSEILKITQSTISVVGPSV
jgi:altronate dehydratase large subunit